MTTTKRDLVLKISKSTELRQVDVTKIVQLTLDTLADEIAAGHTVELRNFGVFETVVQRSRIGRNPRQPENEVIIPDRMVAKFRAGSKLKKQLEDLNTDKFIHKAN
jgi:nucleoid DNA-binding protein